MVAATSLVLAAAAWYSRVLTVDSFYDLYAGRWIATHGLPHQNVITAASRGAPWIDQQWLAHLAFYGAWALGGYPAVAAMSATLVAAGLSLFGLAMLWRGVPPTRMFAWTCCASVACVVTYQIEAQSFAYPLFAAAVWLLLDDSGALRPLRRIWLAIPLLAVWANLHGSVLLGAGLVALYAVWRALTAIAALDRSAFTGYLALGLAAIAAVFCTPYGTGVMEYYRHFVGNDVLVNFVGQWAPPNPQLPATWIFIAIAVAVSAVVAWSLLRRVRPDPVLSGCAVVLLGLAVMASRNIGWFALAGCLLAADTLRRCQRHPVPALGARFTRAVAALLAAAAIASLADLAITPDSQFVSQVPGGAVSAASVIAQRNPRMRILGDAYTGTAMLWTHPAVIGRVGFDVRFEEYTSAQLTAYFDFLFVRGPNWGRVTSGYQILVVSREDRVLARSLILLSGWHVAYADRDGIVVVRRPGTQGAPATTVTARQVTGRWAMTHS